MNMNKTDFVNAVVEAAKVALGEDYTVSVREVVKNNADRLTGLMIRREDQNVCPTVYLDDFFEEYENGEDFRILVEKVLDTYKKGAVKDDIDVSFFEKWELVKDKICYKLVSTQRNEELLKDIPSIPNLDLSVVFFYAYHDEQLGDGSILIHNDHLDRWGVTVEELMEVAKENTPKLFPAQVNSMGDFLREMVGDDPDVLADAESNPMIVLSNKRRFNGAVVALYEGTLAEVAEKVGDSLYVLPSSIHEMIAIPQTLVPDEDYLRYMITSVNRTQLQPQEFLSDTLYFYDKEERSLRVAQGETACVA